MPTYEYECKSCGHNFEVFQSMSEEPLKDCSECGGEIRRLIFGGTGVIFKGSGFYVTDKGKSGKTETKSSKSGDSAQKTESAKSDSSQAASQPAASSKPSADAAKSSASESKAS